MQFGVHLPQVGRQANREQVLRFAREADTLGIESGWVSDHVAWPLEIESEYPYSDTGSAPAPYDIPFLEPLATLLFVAGCTERMRLGTTVMVAGYRPPVQTAKMWSTLDVLSGGRAILGIGIGWMKEEFEALGMPSDNRGPRTDEQLEIFVKLFRDATPSHEGRFYQFPKIGFEPKPLKNHIPIWIGGHTTPALRRAARYGDGLHAAFTDPAGVRESWETLRTICEEQGRDRSELELSLRLYLNFGEGSDEKKSLTGTVDQMVERIGEYAEIGVSHIILDIVARGGADGRLEAMQRFVNDVRPKLPA